MSEALEHMALMREHQLPAALLPVAGIVLLEFPGKRGLLLKLFRRPLLMRTINRLRMKFSRPPTLID